MTDNVMRVIGRLIDGRGRIRGTLVTFETPETLRQALAGKLVQPVYAALIPDADNRENDHMEGRNDAQ